MTIPSGSTNDFPHKDFYVAVAGVIPVLWLTVGLATAALANALKTLGRLGQKVRDSPPALQELMEDAVTAFPKLGVLVLMLRYPGQIFVGTLLVAGTAGETLALYSLLSQSDPHWLRLAVATSTLALIILSAVVVGFALRVPLKALAHAEARARAEIGSGGNLGLSKIRFSGRGASATFRLEAKPVTEPATQEPSESGEEGPTTTRGPQDGSSESVPGASTVGP